MNRFKKIYFVVEGEKTEFDFVKNILAKEFPPDIYVSAIKIKKTRGGLKHYSNFKSDIIRLINQKDAIITTMIDFYALPKDFPGYNKAKKIKDVYDKVGFLEKAIKQDIEETSGKELYHFVPYIQLHEFEALLFSDIEKFSLLYESQIVEDLKEILQQFKGNPELINENKDTAPSKRIFEIIARNSSKRNKKYYFKKTFHGLLLAEEIGIRQMRKMCPHFDQWVETLMRMLILF